MWAHGSVLFMTASGTKVRTFDYYANTGVNISKQITKCLTLTIYYIL